MPLRIVTFKVDEELLERLDCLVAAGVFDSRSEAIREAIRRLVEELGSCSAAARARLYRCPVCGAELPYHELRRHVERHLVEGWNGEAWRCPLCGRRFTSRDSLVEHLSLAADERHALLWALVSHRPRYRDRIETIKRRKELLEKLAVEG